MKKICVLKWIIDSVDGGLKVGVEVANELSNNYEVHFVSMTSVMEAPFFDFSEKVKYHNFKKGHYKLSTHIFMFSRILKKYLLANEIDVVMSVGISANTLMILATRGTGIKTISCEHINANKLIASKSDRVQRYIGAKFADKIITLTEGDRKNYIDTYHLSEQKVQCIYNWIDSDQSIKPININDKKLVTVGRFSHQKGYDLLAQVASKVLKNHPDWQWDIYGAGNEQIKNKLINDLKQSSVISQVNFKASVKGTHNIYPGCSIYVMTSYFEGLPLVLLEAKQYGLPIISFDCPTGPNEIVRDGTNGYLIEPYDVDKMSDMLSKLMLDEALRHSFSQAAYLDIDKFNKHIIVNQWKNLIESMV